MAPVLAKRRGLSVAEALDKVRCQHCGIAIEIAGMSKSDASYGEHWLLLRRRGLRWRG